MTLDPLIRCIKVSDGDDDAGCGAWVLWPKITIGATETRGEVATPKLSSGQRRREHRVSTVLVVNWNFKFLVVCFLG